MLFQCLSKLKGVRIVGYKTLEVGWSVGLTMQRTGMCLLHCEIVVAMPEVVIRASCSFIRLKGNWAGIDKHVIPSGCDGGYTTAHLAGRERLDLPLTF